MNPRDKAELEAVLEYARKVRDNPKTDRVYAEVLDRWIKRDEGALSMYGAMSLATIVEDINEQRD